MDKASDLLSKIGKNGKGAGAGLGLLAAAGGLAYGLSKSFYTG